MCLHKLAAQAHRLHGDDPFAFRLGRGKERSGISRCLILRSFFLSGGMTAFGFDSRMGWHRAYKSAMTEQVAAQNFIPRMLTQYREEVRESHHKYCGLLFVIFCHGCTSHSIF